MDGLGRFYQDGKLLSQAAIEQRLRRLCTLTKRGSLKKHCSQELYDKYHHGTETRTELVELFKEMKLSKVAAYGVRLLRFQADLNHKVKKQFIDETQKSMTVDCGWYTERQMRDILKMPQPEPLHFSAFHFPWQGGD